MYFGASFAPRMEQAASQIQDSRDLLVFVGFANGPVPSFAGGAIAHCTEVAGDLLPFPEHAESSGDPLYG